MLQLFLRKHTEYLTKGIGYVLVLHRQAAILRLVAVLEQTDEIAVIELRIVLGLGEQLLPIVGVVLPLQQHVLVGRWHLYRRARLLLAVPAERVPTGVHFDRGRAASHIRISNRIALLHFQGGGSAEGMALVTGSL